MSSGWGAASAASPWARRSGPARTWILPGPSASTAPIWTWPSCWTMTPSSMAVSMPASTGQPRTWNSISGSATASDIARQPVGHDALNLRVGADRHMGSRDFHHLDHGPRLGTEGFPFQDAVVPADHGGQRHGRRLGDGGKVA